MAKKTPKSFADKLRNAVKADERTPHAVAVDAGIAPIVLMRFLHGERSLNVETFEKLCRVVGLELK